MRFAAILVGTILSAGLASAADPPRPTTTGDPAIPTAELELRLKPLTKAELTIEADGWLGLVKEKVAEISEAEIQAAKLKDQEQSAKLEQIARLRDERIARTDRLNLVLRELGTKGGTVADYETYVNAVSGIKMQVTDTSAAWRTVINWVKSENGGIRYGKNILLFFVTLIVFMILASIVGGVMRRAMGSFRHVSHLLRDFSINATRKVIMFVGFVVALSMLEVNIGPFLAAMGAVGFVIGFALQGTLSNFAAGIMILLYRPYDLQDEVTVAGQTGKVTSMTLVSTVLHNKDGHIVTIPNSAIWGGTIVNLSAAPVPVKAA
jgi:small conductance mechanosensitive channel